VRKLLSGSAAAAVLAIALGVANTFVLYGRGPIDPTNTSWIFGDNATYYAGWALYRHDPHLHFPLAWTERVGYPIGTSIAMLDAMPLVAILLRPLSPLLPEPFQYLGLYTALCFVLQAYFGISLCRRLFPANPVFAAVGAAFFLLSPPLTNRAFGHTTLLSHWLILASLDSYFRDPGDRPVRWLARLWIVLAIATGITPYIAFMCLLVALAGVGRLLIERRVPFMRGALLLGATALVVGVSGATFGVLVARDPAAYWAPGYGGLSMNLNALVNPMQAGSILLPALPLANPQQYEGYNYLGLGMIALLALNLVRRPEAVAWLRERRLIPLVALALVCTIVAVSAVVSFGPWTLVRIPLPSPIAAAAAGLRASGRLFWPGYYLIVAAALSLTFWTWRPRARLWILAAAVALQFVDLIPMRTRVRTVLDQRFSSPLQSPVWHGLGRRYDTLVLLPPYQCSGFTTAGGPYSYVFFGQLAAAERMRTNSYYAARYTYDQLHAHCVDLMRTELQGTLDPRSVYVVTDPVQAVWRIVGMRSHRCDVVDGFNLCMPVDPANAAPPVPAAPAAKYRTGQVIDFSGPGVRPYMTFGWENPGGTGAWTVGPLAMLRLGLDGVDQSRALLLDVDAQALITPNHPQLDVDVVVNGRTMDRWTFRTPAAIVHRRTRIAAGLASERGGLDIEFRIFNPEAPLYLGTAAASDLVGLNVASLVVRPE
jgi:hypothetical protein